MCAVTRQHGATRSGGSVASTVGTTEGRQRGPAGALSATANELFRRLPRALTADAAAALRLDPTGSWVVGEAGGRDLGTHVRFYLQVAKGVVVAARFQAYGCPHTLAACALAAAEIEGRPVTSGSPEGPHQWAAQLDVPVEKLGRLLVIEDALQVALRGAQHG